MNLAAMAKLGDKFGESLEGSQATPSFWEVSRLPRKFPELPRKFCGDFPGGSLTVELSSNPGVPRKFPGLPRKFPKLPRKFPDFPGGQALSLGSLTPSPDSQKLSLKSMLAACHSRRNYYISYRQILARKDHITWWMLSADTNFVSEGMAQFGTDFWLETLLSCHWSGLHILKPTTSCHSTTCNVSMVFDYPLRRNDYQNNSINIFSCNCPGAITGFSCRAPEKNSPKIVSCMGPCPVRAPAVIAPGALTGFSCRAPENNSKIIFSCL